MGSGKRHRPRRRNGAKGDSKPNGNNPDAVPIGPSNPFPVCAVPSSIPARYRHVVENLSSHVALHRAISCSALSNIVCDDGRVAIELIGAGIVPVVLPLLIDADADVACHAAGLLRNLAVADGTAMAAAIHSLDVFDKIVALALTRVGQPPSPWIAQVLALIACLTEHDDLVGSAVVCNGSIWNLSAFLSGPTDAVVAVLETFRNVVDDRPELAQSLINSHLAVILPLLEHRSVLVRAHTAALLAAMARMVQESAEVFLSLIAPHLLLCASLDLAAATRNLIADGRRARAEIDAELERQRAAHTGETIFQESIGGRLAPEAQEHAWQGLFQSFREQVVAVQISAETVANLVCVDPEETSWDLNRVAELVGVRQIAPKLADRIHAAIDDDRLDTDDWVRVFDLVFNTTERCIESMINLVVNEVVQGADVFDLTLDLIGRECRRAEPRMSLLEVAGRLLSLSMASTAKDLTPDQLQMLAALTRTPSDRVRQEFVAVLVRFGMHSPLKSDMVAEIVCERLQDESVGVLLEAVNGLIDMFAEDVVHMKTFARLNLVSVLSAVAADDRRWSCCSHELADEADEARENLQRFVQYRSSCP